MSVLLILPLLGIVGLLGYLVHAASEEPRPPADPEAELRAAVELHRIRRRLDAAWVKSQQRQDGRALRRQINQALDDETDDRP